MKDIIKGYRQMMAGWFGLLVLVPGLFISIGLITLFVKYAVKMVIWLW